MGEHAHPEVSMHTFPLSDYMSFIAADDWNGVGRLMAKSAEKLRRVGADFMICPDNTIHQAFDVAEERSVAPWLHIARSVAKLAASRGFEKIGITGTAYLMSGPVYPEALARHDIDFALPSADDRLSINEIIFGRLVKGVYDDESRSFFVSVFEKLAASGCDAVVMGCTEIPILMDGVATPIPALDSTRTLARAALAEALA